MEIQDKELHRITSTAIIYKQHRGENKYLLLQRSFEKKAFGGKWTVPGGGLETDDYINTSKTTHDHWYFAVENSLRREIREEANLEVGEIKYLLDITFIRPDSVPTVILSFWCPFTSGEVRLDKDSINYVWATYSEAKGYDMVEGLLEEIEMVEKILNGGEKVTYNKKS